jgi:hypothetical protein
MCKPLSMQFATPRHEGGVIEGEWVQADHSLFPPCVCSSSVMVIRDWPCRGQDSTPVAWHGVMRALLLHADAVCCLQAASARHLCESCPLPMIAGGCAATLQLTAALQTNARLGMASATPLQVRRQSCAIKHLHCSIHLRGESTATSQGACRHCNQLNSVQALPNQFRIEQAL